MGVIDSFLERYSKEVDFFHEAARLCAQRCETELEQSGIRAIVTFRAKRPERLRDKVIARNQEKNYRRVKQIYDDIVDMSGVRIALYFPGDANDVEGMIEKIFDVDQKKLFPRDSSSPPYNKRFSGYAARHYRIRMRPSELPVSSARYSDASIEIQVASVLIHAWAEVEHDLVYKPMSGQLSDEEYAILDELNGLVLAGEIALERLQHAGEARLLSTEGHFANHYELAAYIYGRFTN